MLCSYVEVSELGDVGAELRAHVAECSVDGAGQTLHAGSCTEGDQSDDQGILNQILTFFAVLQILELDIELQKHIIHLFTLRFFDFPSLSRGTSNTATRVPFFNLKCLFMNQQLSESTLRA
jgi:hypothetical protein